MKNNLKHFEINHDEIFVDVEANVGFYSLATASKNKKCKIIAIETHPDNFSTLNRNIQCNQFHNIITINCAVSDKSGV